MYNTIDELLRLNTLNINYKSILCNKSELWNVEKELNKICFEIYRELSRINSIEYKSFINSLREKTGLISLKLCDKYPSKLITIEGLLIDFENIYDKLISNPIYICNLFKTIRRALFKNLLDYLELIKIILDFIEKQSIG